MFFLLGSSRVFYDQRGNAAGLSEEIFNINFSEKTSHPGNNSVSFVVFYWNSICNVCRASKNSGGVKWLFDGIINNRFISIYWYFIPLIGVYLCIPFASAIEENKKISIYSYSIAAGFIFVSVIPTVFHVFSIPFNSGIIPPMFNGYILYVLMGYIIRRVEIRSVYRKILYILGIAGFAFQYFGTDILSRNSGSIDSTFKGYLNFPAVLQAVAVIVIFRYIPYDRLNERFVRTIAKISKHTFGVYLMHIYFVWQLPRILNIDSSSIFFRTIGAVLIFAICILLCWMLSKVPVVNKILGC